jgi:hypothetical protein
MRGILCGLILAFLWYRGANEDIAHAANPATLLVDYRSPSGVAVEELLAGAMGEAFLLYYLPERGVTDPRVVVHFRKPAPEGLATVALYTLPSGQLSMPLTLTETSVVLEPSLRPALIMQAAEGWWVRNGIANYNLELEVYTPAYAMWGGIDDPAQAPTGWQANLAPGELAVTITVRDSDGDGQPDWEWRELVPPFPGKGYYRTHYAENTCDHARKTVAGITPWFPYLGLFAEFEQPAGEFHPPFIVNWTQGQLTHVAEMVAVRATPCSYTFYSVSPLTRDRHNQPNFETPFAFYDLGATGSDLPNLILRTERYPAQDPWSLGIDPAVQSGKHPVPADVETIRYSWRTAPGDGLWDYKVETLGFFPYTATTPIGDGQTTIDAPAYPDFPRWVLEREWPVVTFVAAEGRTYRSTEGIYDWSPFELGVGYLFGWHDAPKTEGFQAIAPGLRGEYRYTSTDRPLLYFSPIDQRLHLQGAEAGRWNLGTGQQVRLHSSNHLYIDGWTRERDDLDAPPVEALYRLDGYLLYAGNGKVLLKQVEVPLAEFMLLPPHDDASWDAFNAHLNREAATTRPGDDLYRWFMAYEGPIVTLPDTTLEMVRMGTDGYEWSLEVARPFRGNATWFQQGPIAAGAYHLTYADGFRLIPVVAAPLALTITRENATGIHVLVANSASFSTEALHLRAIATNGNEAVRLLNQPFRLDPGANHATRLAWEAPTAGQWRVKVQVEDEAGTIVTEQSLVWLTTPALAPSASEVWKVSAPAVQVVKMQAAIVGLMVMALGVLLHRLKDSFSV